jgi:hypothetical protein
MFKKPETKQAEQTQSTGHKYEPFAQDGAGTSAGDSAANTRAFEQGEEAKTVKAVKTAGVPVTVAVPSAKPARPLGRTVKQGPLAGSP